MQYASCSVYELVLFFIGHIMTPFDAIFLQLLRSTGQVIVTCSLTCENRASLLSIAKFALWQHCQLRQCAARLCQLTKGHLRSLRCVAYIFSIEKLSLVDSCWAFSLRICSRTC
jgi:hypothetical protein